jgi:hypothetical protein
MMAPDATRRAPGQSGGSNATSGARHLTSHHRGLDASRSQTTSAPTVAARSPSEHSHTSDEAPEPKPSTSASRRSSWR